MSKPTAQQTDTTAQSTLRDNVVPMQGTTGTRPVDAVYQAAHDQALLEQQCWVVEESMLNIELEALGSYSLMWTPTAMPTLPCAYTAEDGLLGAESLPEPLAICAGFLLSEGIIRTLSDLHSMSICADLPDVVQVKLAEGYQPQPRRKNVVINSACGICGGREQLQSELEALPQVSDKLRCRGNQFSHLMSLMHQRQTVFAKTGGAHSAAIFSPQGQLLAQAEDLGRHNALDKVIGHCLLSALPMQGCGVLLSSRISLEMVSKAARAGLELIAAVSAPTSLAIDTATRAGITLCGFVRGERLTVFSHPHRLGATAEKLPRPQCSY